MSVLRGQGVGLPTVKVSFWPGVRRHKGVSLLEQGLDDPGQGLRGMDGGVVEEDDGTGAHPAYHPLGDLACREFLPVQTVAAPNSFKALGSSANRTGLVIRAGNICSQKSWLFPPVRPPAPVSSSLHPLSKQTRASCGCIGAGRFDRTVSSKVPLSGCTRAFRSKSRS